MSLSALSGSKREAFLQTEGTFASPGGEERRASLTTLDRPGIPLKDVDGSICGGAQQRHSAPTCWRWSYTENVH